MAFSHAEKPLRKDGLEFGCADGHIQAMIIALRILAALLLIGVLTLAHSGFSVFFDKTGPIFAFGFAVGGAFIAVVFLFANWLDSPARSRSPRP